MVGRERRGCMFPCASRPAGAELCAIVFRFWALVSLPAFGAGARVAACGDGLWCQRFARSRAERCRLCLVRGRLSSRASSFERDNNRGEIVHEHFQSYGTYRYMYIHSIRSMASSACHYIPRPAPRY